MTLRALMGQATAERRVRWAARELDHASDDFARGATVQTAMDLEARLAGALARTVDVGALLSAVAGLHHSSWEAIASMDTSAGGPHMPASSALALAFAFSDIVEYAVSAVSPGECVDMCLAVAREGQDVVVALGVEGDHGFVGSLDRSRALQRAVRIVAAIGGGFERGVRDGRMVYGIVVPGAGSSAAVA